MKDSREAAGGRAGGGGEAGWITVRHAARQLGVTPRQLYELIDRGALAAYHREGDVKLRGEDVAAYRDRHLR